MYKVVYSDLAIRDYSSIPDIQKKNIVNNIIKLISQDPYSERTPYAKLKGSLNLIYCREYGSDQRMFYEVIDYEQCVAILAM